MSVEQPLWRALTGYRVLTLVYALCVFCWMYDEYAHPLAGLAYLLVLTVWNGATLRNVSSARRCTKRFLAADVLLALVGILLSLYVDALDAVGPTLPSIWVAGPVLAFAIKGGWRWGAIGSVLVGVANVVESGTLTRSTLHNVLLVCVASIGIGYVVEVARASERTLARALQIEAATRERERLARDIHDSVLQVLAMVQRRGTAIGGEAAELGRMAGEQEAALRALVSSGVVPAQRDGTEAEVPAAVRTGADGLAEPASRDASAPAHPEGTPPADDGHCDVRALLAPHSGSRVSYAEPGTPVVLPVEAARELAAAVGAALDNVRRHAGGPGGEEAQAWILLEDEPDAVLVTVRDDGPGIPAGRLADAEAEGRMGVALSIRGRLRDLGGSAELTSVPGQGTEVELKVPK
ncbi:sensor histidine kinase [Streptomyces sp. HNM0574]|nr:sensor histidine kinase [Streptomyces sp. HNM0574]